MKKLDKITFLSTMAIMSEVLSHGDYSRNMERKPRETPEEKEARINQAERERNKSRGLSEFFYGENSLWALNQKSADKKAQLRNWI